MSNQSTCRAQLKQLKKAIQTEIHRETGRRPPLLANNVAFEDPITFENLAPNNAWYILPNTTNSNTIRQLYKKNTLNRILTTSRRSPFTRKSMTNGNIRKYLNFKPTVPHRPAPRNTPPPAPVRANRRQSREAGSVRRMLTYGNNNQGHNISTQLLRIRDLMVLGAPPGEEMRVTATDGSRSVARIIIRKERPRLARNDVYVFRGIGGPPRTVPGTRFMETLRQVVRDAFPRTNLRTLRIQSVIIP